MGTPVRKIALIGPESSGKTTLAEKLAMHFETRWVPEYAREFIGNLGRAYTLADIEHCARMQLSMEKELEASARQFLFCDTELIVAKVWCEDVFHKTPPWLEEAIRANPYDLFLLLKPDLPFTPDPVRENPLRREFFFDWYKKELVERNFKYEEISGLNEVRFSNALKALEKYFPLY